MVTDTGLDVLTPKAASLDDRGRVLYAPREYAKPAVAPMTVELRPWWNMIEDELKIDAYKSAFRTACWNFQQQHRLLQQDIVIIRKGTEVLVKTTAAVAANQLVIPMFFRKHSSVCTAGETKGNKHHYAVDAAITFPTTEHERLSGIEQAQNEIDLTVGPELKVPSAEPGKQPKATKGDNMHPFWAITRRQKKDDVCNCLMGSKLISVVVCAPAGPDDAPEYGSTLHAHIPYIYNDAALEKGTTLVLSWHLKPEEQKAKKNRTWRTDFESREQKRARQAVTSGA